MVTFPTLLRLSALSITTCLTQTPPTSEGLTIINATNYPGATISFKQTYICETTDSVKGYSGYVNLPADPDQGRNYPQHTWFWYFEARKDPANAPLTIYQQGGPGAPTAPSVVGEMGPCTVLDNSRDTSINPWSWNERVNMLFIDQPVQTGFSYDTLINGTINEPRNPFSVDPTLNTNLTTGKLAGVFSSQNGGRINSTSAAAPAFWEFMQVWMQEFPEYDSKDSKFSVWGESYAGHWLPTFVDYFYTQNERIASGELSAATTTEFSIETIGLINACIDADTQVPQYPHYAMNNTYGVKMLNDSAYTAAMATIPLCLNQSRACRTMSERLDPLQTGNTTIVNQVCLQAYQTCFVGVATESFAGSMPSGLYRFDIGVSTVNSFPPRWPAGYLNRADVQQALGVPLNFTGNSDPISQSFTLAGDFIKGRNLAILGQMLNRGVKVALMYGDRDYQCNWFGGEAISLAINSTISSDFQQAGYTSIQTNAGYVGGMVRQHGNLSFSRVYNAGHSVPAYQPETAYQIFNRVMFNSDVSTGAKAISNTYSTTGPTSALTGKVDVFTTFETKVRCYYWDVLETCNALQTAMIANGSAIFQDYILVGYKLANGQQMWLNGSINAGSSGSSVGSSMSNSTGTSTGTAASGTAAPSVTPFKGVASKATVGWIVIAALTMAVAIVS